MNKLLHPKLMRFIALCVIYPTIAGLLPITRLKAEDGADFDIAVLQKGPLVKKGIPLLPPNIIPTFYGEYSYKNEIISLYYTREEIVPSKEWQAFTCGRKTHLRIPGERRVALFYDSGNNWYVFFSFPPGIENPCLFSDLFIDRLNYFLGISGSSAVVPFPAVLQFSR
ncbi:MAG: hypothetical protein AB1798_15470 [Spirochaetota bacterium]